MSLAYHTNEYFVPKDGIDREVITSGISWSLGDDAKNPQTRQVQQGYFITAYRNLTIAMIVDLRADSERWVAERRQIASREQHRQASYGKLSYQASATHQSRQYYGPTEPVPGAFTPNISYSSTPLYLTDNHYSPLIRLLEKPTSRGTLDATEEGPAHLLKQAVLPRLRDLGAAANVMDVKVARKLRLEVVLDSSCVLSKLPTFGKTIKPIRWVTVETNFPNEPASRARERFFVFENFIWQVIMGRFFLRETRTLDIYRHRLPERPLEVHDVPIVAFLPGEEEFKFWLDGEELPSTPDTGSEINVMSYDFAVKRFPLQPDAITHVRFADGSSQQVEGKVSVPVSFGNGAPPSFLLKLVDLNSRSVGPIQTPATDGALNYGTTASILADFYVPKGLKVDIIQREYLLATVNAFVRHSTDFDELRTRNSLYPGLVPLSQ